MVYEVSDDAEVEETPLLVTRLPARTQSWTPPADRCLVAGEQYAWAIRALDEGKAESWSEAALIEVLAVPSTDDVREAMAILRRHLAGQKTGADAREREREIEEPVAASPLEERASPPQSARSGGSGSAARPETLTPEVASATGPAPALGQASLTVSDQIHLDAVSDFFKRGELFLWDDTSTGNLALGEEALESASGTAIGNTAVGKWTLRETVGGTGAHGAANTALGAEALRENTIGFRNTASGFRALVHNTTGDDNTASGANALYSNTTGDDNTASGVFALFLNTTGNRNTASGAAALDANTTGSRNTASGASALGSNTSGYNNTASGYAALFSNTSQVHNTAVGAYALHQNAGLSNTALGVAALRYNMTGDLNTASGLSALRDNTTGNRNVAIGGHAGSLNATGSDSIFISNLGADTDDATIKIGTQGTQLSTFIAGIFGTAVSGSGVEVTSSGQLGVAAPSSVRFKKGIEDIGGVAKGLRALRPVSFRYRPELVAGDAGPQVGLLAEEVAQIFPELVTRDADGKPFGVRYELLSVLLLAELQRREQKLEQREAALARQDHELQEQEVEFAALRRRVIALEGVEPSGHRCTRWWRRPFGCGRGSP